MKVMTTGLQRTQQSPPLMVFDYGITTATAASKRVVPLCYYVLSKQLVFTSRYNIHTSLLSIRAYVCYHICMAGSGNILSRFFFSSSVLGSPYTKKKSVTFIASSIFSRKISAQHQSIPAQQQQAEQAEAIEQQCRSRSLRAIEQGYCHRVERWKVSIIHK